MAELSIYVVSQRDGVFSVLLSNGQVPRIALDKTYLNPMYAAARVVYEWLVRPLSQEEWEGMSYFYDNQFKNVLRLVTMNCFFFKEALYMPTPNLEFPDELHPAADLVPVLEAALALATPCEASTEAIFESYTQHADPDFITLSLQDFSIWNGVMEATNVGNFKQGLERWNLYVVPRGDLPRIEDMPSLKGLVLSGGMYSIADLDLP